MGSRFLSAVHVTYISSIVQLHFSVFVLYSLGVFHLYSVLTSVVFEQCSWQKTSGCQLCGLCQSQAQPACSALPQAVEQDRMRRS